MGHTCTIHKNVHAMTDIILRLLNTLFYQLHIVLHAHATNSNLLLLVNGVVKHLVKEGSCLLIILRILISLA